MGITVLTTRAGHTVRIHDPAATPEAKAKRQERIERACVRFWESKEREAKA